MPDNPFDSLSTRVFGSISETMGYDASWSPESGDPALTARVLFEEPTQDQLIGELSDAFSPRTYFIEYWDGDFTGLFESSRGTGEETITIEIRGESRDFYVRFVEAKFDGRNYLARLEEITA